MGLRFRALLPRKLAVQKLAALLVELEETWLRNGMPDTHWLAAGLPAGEVEAALDAIGLAAPVEIIEWFGWHNGASGSSNLRQLRPGLGTGGIEPLSLTRALDERALMMELAASLAEDPMAIPEDLPLWHSEWLPVGAWAHGALLTVELGARETVPVRVVDWEDGEFKTVRAESLARVVELWIEWLDAYCEWDSVLHTWRLDFAALPLDVRLRGLI